MQPERGGDDRDREAGEAGDESRGKSPGDKQNQIRNRKAVHGTPHLSAAQERARRQGNAWPVTAEGWLPVPDLIFGPGRSEVNWTLRENSGLPEQRRLPTCADTGPGRRP